MKLMILGHAQHGKDSVCDILARDYGLSFESSSKFVAEKAVRPALAAQGITYPDYDAMYADRVNHRQAWYDAIRNYNTPDQARLGREILAVHDVYCGMRSADEFMAVKAAGIVDFTIWVDASERCPPESEKSCTVTRDMADYVLDNNGPIEKLWIEIEKAVAAARESMK